MENLDIISCQIIACSGSAKSCYIEAIEEAKKGHFEEAERLIKEGASVYIQGHESHSKLLQMSAEGNLEIPLLLMHAEDQMMNCETMKILASEIISIYKENMNLSEKVYLLNKNIEVTK